MYVTFCTWNVLSSTVTFCRPKSARQTFRNNLFSLKSFGHLVVHERKGLLGHRVLPHRGERLAVQCRRPKLAEGSDVFGRTVSLVRCQPVFRKDGIPLAHHAIALHLRQD